MDRIIQLDPDTRFDIVGHSMGGMVAAYLVATSPTDYVSEHVRSVITLDSPLDGFSDRHLGSVCAYGSPAWDDILGISPVVGEIASIRDQLVLDRFLSITSSPIGDVIQGTRSQSVDCSSGATLGYGVLGTIVIETIFPGFGIIGAILGAVKGAYGVGHTCVGSDSTALASLGDFINRPQ